MQMVVHGVTLGHCRKRFMKMVLINTLSLHEVLHTDRAPVLTTLDSGNEAGSSIKTRREAKPTSFSSWLKRRLTEW